MAARIRKLAVLVLTLALLSLSAGPLALFAANDGHFHMSCGCSVCTAIRDDLAALELIATAFVVLITFRVALARALEAISRVSAGHPALLPIALKVRMNN